MGKKTEQQESEEQKDVVGEEQAATAEVCDTEEMSPEDQLRSELTQAQDEAKGHHERYLRTLADMENLRKRTQREKEELSKFANENIIKEILPVIDNLERAVEHATASESSDSGLLEGVKMTLVQFSQVIERFGVVPVDAQGQMFDPNLHQAMGQIESDLPVNTVVQQMQKGYQLNGRLLRPAFVMIAKAPAAAQNEDNEKTDEE